ncbi:MAG TPA: glycosyltransferase family 4 protein [Hanamia sp.]|nr:glycosyltransferase family 4 protein [Hanamia sp.]
MDSFIIGNMVPKSLQINIDDPEMKKIAVIENGLFSTYTMRDGLMQFLLKEGYDVTILTHTNSFESQVEKTGLKVINIGAGNMNPVKVSKYIFNLYKVLKKIEPDVCLTFSIRPAIWGNFITRYLKIPTITNITGVGPLFTSKNFAYRIARFIYRSALSKTKKVFFQNFDDMDLFIEKKFVTKNVAERIPGSGVDYQKFSPFNFEGKENLVANGFIFLFIGRLIKDKGIFEFVEAARSIRKKYPNIIFNVIGPFWHQNLKSNTITKTDLQNWITEGVIDYQGEKKDVRKFIDEADCIVLPSYREGTSNILLEAASMERPVICTNTTGCKEIVEDGVTGFLCKVKDSYDLAVKMEKMLLLSSEERKCMGKKGRQKIIKEFDKQIVIDAYLKTIHQVLK